MGQFIWKDQLHNNQLNITQFNMPGLAASTGTGAGTILEYGLAGKILCLPGLQDSLSHLHCHHC